ncbi:type VI secretion system baseplate subunit TssE [Limnoglobus roseus]|uniref:Type VI secretion system baseplate subunit TssE n=1 Tax=Limnoglobus roseus TaxID=2598579 RepID=A0A5C1AKJ5_9BACT|nr:type VI secretion system baseplate subunit TssE [Limnoglobus roseus]QEL19741.1 type VI secretion system baseplate subunit TssE [Limnoglobus roseus]
MEDYPPSFFNRLTDPTIAANRCRYSLTQTEVAVLRDLEDLLNTKRPPDEYFAGLDMVSRSIANFGLRDATHQDGSSPHERLKIAEHILDVIQTHEPRLTNVQVIPRSLEEVKAEQPKGYRIGAAYFRIVATLNVDPTPIEGVVFDTMLELATGHHNVSSPGGIA